MDDGWELIPASRIMGYAIGNYGPEHLDNVVKVTQGLPGEEQTHRGPDGGRRSRGGHPHSHGVDQSDLLEVLDALLQAPVR